MSADYLLLTDTCADLNADFVEDAGLAVVGFPYTLGGEEHTAGVGDDLSSFYAAMREGSTPATSAVSPGTYAECFAGLARDGVEIVYLSFSSALSSSFGAAEFARDTVIAENPGVRIRVIDTRRASIAQGALVIEAVRRRDAGATADEIEEWVITARDRTAGYFTADTLEHLRRGGRVSDVAAIAGAMLDIRPVLTFDDHGGLELHGVVRGRKRSLRALAEKVAAAPQGATLIIGHADSPSDAERLGGTVAEERPDLEQTLCEIGPVIGSHTGPGMVAVSFIAGT